MMNAPRIALFVLLPALLTTAGCRSTGRIVETSAVIEPIQFTVDVNTRVRQALHDFFDDLDRGVPQPESSGVRYRISQRSASVQALKEAGTLGEDLYGYLDYMTGQHPEEQLVIAENTDRSMVYKIIAQHQKTTASLVGRRRAEQIRELATSGTHLQQSDGSWQRKP